MLIVWFLYGTWEYTEVVLCLSVARQWWTSKQHFSGEKIKQKRRFIFPFFFFVHPGTVFSSRFFKGSPFLLGTHYLFQSYTDFIENIRNPEKYFDNLTEALFCFGGRFLKKFKVQWKPLLSNSISCFHMIYCLFRWHQILCKIISIHWNLTYMRVCSVSVYFVF